MPISGGDREQQFHGRASLVIRIISPAWFLNRILEIPSAPYTNWWGWTNTVPGSQVNPTDNPYETSPAFIMDDPTLISWVVSKMANIAGGPTSGFHMAVRELTGSFQPEYQSPAHGCVHLYSQDPYTIPLQTGRVQLNSEPWVREYNQAYSGAYYSFVTAVASQAGQMGYTGLVGALAYADVFPPPINIATFPTNVQVEVCLYGAPNLPMNASANAGMKAALTGWHNTSSHLATYGYALLHTDYWEQDPRLPVPLVAGIVNQAQYLASIGALDGGCQGNLTSIPYNPWNFYAYPRVRWNTNQAASTLETEFFNGYFREAAAPMLAYYQGLENYQVTNGINMHYMGYCYGITPGSVSIECIGGDAGQSEKPQHNWQPTGMWLTAWPTCRLDLIGSSPMPV